MKYKHVFLLYSSLLIIIGCANDPLKRVNVEEIPVSIKIDRFEQDLFALSQAPNAEAKIPELRKKYPDFFEKFNQSIIGIGPSESSGYINNLKTFTRDKYIKQVYDDCQKEFPSMQPYEAGLTDAFKHYKYYFPDRLIPHVFTFFSGFNYAMVVDDSTLAIGLDMYLGPAYKYYSLIPQLPKYMVARMKKDNIVADAVKGWCSTEFEAKPGSDLLSLMIAQGKIHYMMDALIPEVADSVKIGYTGPQMEWAIKNEFNMWTFFIDRKLLFSKQDLENAKFINDAPFTAGMPNESAPKAGVYIGWQIVRAYMKKNSKVTLKDLVAENDAQKILSLSGYKPRKQ